MDFAYILKVLFKRKWLIIATILIPAIFSLYFLSFQPEKFKSDAILSTGIIEYKGVSLTKENAFVQKFQIESSFNQLLEFMQSRKIIKLLSYKLLKHDLESPKSSFRTPKPTEFDFSKDDIESFLNLVVASPPSQIEELTPAQYANFNKLAKIFKYDYESIKEDLNVNRIGNTDYVSIEFISENPNLSYFTVNTFCNEFMGYYESNLNSSKINSVNFYKKAVEEKKKQYDDKLEEYNKYKRQNQVVDISSQSKTVVGQIKDLEIALEEERQKIPALEKAISSLNAYIRNYSTSNNVNSSYSSELKASLQSQRKKIEKLNDKYIGGGMKDEQLKKTIEKERKHLSTLVSRMASTNSVSDDDTRTKDKIDNLFREKINKEMELELAQSSVNSIQIEITNLRARSVGLVTNDATLNKLEQDMNIYEKEYLTLSNKLHEAELFSEETKIPLTVIEPPFLPEKPESSNKFIISAFAGMAGGTLTSIILLLLTFLDSRIKSISQYNKSIGLKLLETVYKVDSNELTFEKLFSSNGKISPQLEMHYEIFRNLRYVISKSQDKVFLFVSPEENAGKSTIILSLAQALAKNNKKVLIIDFNLKNNNITSLIYRKNKNQKSNTPNFWMFFNFAKNIDIIGNKGSNKSPLELFSEDKIREDIHNYKNAYDFIFIETAGLNTFSGARELTQFADKIIAIFSAEATISYETSKTINFLKSMGDKFFGTILNNVDKEYFE